MATPFAVEQIRIARKAIAQAREGYATSALRTLGLLNDRYWLGEAVTTIVGGLTDRRDHVEVGDFLALVEGYDKAHAEWAVISTMIGQIRDKHDLDQVEYRLREFISQYDGKDWDLVKWAKVLKIRLEANE